MKKIVFIVIVIASVLIINNLAHSIYSLWQKQDLITKTEEQLARQKVESKSLKEKLLIVKRPEFVEQEARNKLFLVKPGEQIVLVPKDLTATTEAKKTAVEQKPNWQQWCEVFF